MLIAAGFRIQIFVPPPDASGRRAVWDVHASRLVAAGALDDGAQRLIDDPGFFADGGATDGFSGAEIEGLVRALASYALERASAGADAVVTARDVQRPRRRGLDRARRKGGVDPRRGLDGTRGLCQMAGGPPTDRAEVLAFLRPRPTCMPSLLRRGRATWTTAFRICIEALRRG